MKVCAPLKNDPAYTRPSEAGELDRPAHDPAPIIQYVVVPETVDLNTEHLLRVVTGGLIRTRDKALKLSRRKFDPLPVHRLANGERGAHFIVTTEYREWAARQELI